MAGPKWDPDLLWTSLILVGILLLGALAIFIVDRWRKKTPPVHPSAGDQLAHFRTLYERGELSLEEYNRIRQLLTPRLITEINEQAPVAAETPKQESLPPGGQKPDRDGSPPQSPSPSPPANNGPALPA